MPKKLIKNKKKTTLVKVNRLTASLTIILISVVLLLVYKRLFPSNRVPVTSQGPSPTNGLKATWVPYTNAQFKYALNYPISLTVFETKDKGGYLEFTRFDENGLTGDKGIGVGVRKNDLKSEVIQIKKEFNDMGDGKLVSENNLKIGDYEAVELSYEPKDPTNAEKRSVVILSNDNYAYSISTVPEQIIQVLETFRILN